MGASPPPSCSAFRGAPRGCPGACGGFPRRLPHERAPLARQCRACGEAPPTPRRRSPVRPFPAGLCPPGARGILRAHAPACFSSRRTGLPPAPVSPKPSGADAGPAGRPAVGACPGPRGSLCLPAAGPAFLPGQRQRRPLPRAGAPRVSGESGGRYFTRRITSDLDFCDAEPRARPGWFRVPRWSQGRRGAASRSWGEGTAFPVRWPTNRDPDFAEPGGHCGEKRGRWGLGCWSVRLSGPGEFCICHCE